MRLHNYHKPIIGLTGGIATGKSTVARFLRTQGYTVLDADQLIKKIYLKKSTLDWFNNNYPEYLHNNEVDFKKLRKDFFNNKNLKDEIEKLLYTQLPEVFKEEANKFESSFLFYDIPLLYEKKLQEQFDAIILVYAPLEAQLKRLCERDNISIEEARKIIDAQVPIEKKKKLAEYIIDNSASLDKKSVLALVNKIEGKIHAKN